MKSKTYNENPCSVQGYMHFLGLGYGLWSNSPANSGGKRMLAHV